MQFFWKHLHNNKGDENVSKLIWIVIAFVIGALLLSTMSVAFRTEGAIGGWLSSSLEEWFGEADGRDGSVGGGTGGSGGGNGDPSGPLEPPATEKFEHSGKIPAGGLYYVGVTSTKTGDYSNITPLTEGADFPISQTGDIYIYGDYEYRYNKMIRSIVWTNNPMDGWGVDVLDKTKTEYGPILESINNQPIKGLGFTFSNCKSLTEAPEIPSGVTNMSYTFYSCTSLTQAPVIPENVTDISGIFSSCVQLKTYYGSIDPDGDFSNYIIPNNVANMYAAFKDCYLLTKAPLIPNLVTDLSESFYNCKNLVIAPNLPKNATGVSGMFISCKSLKTYYGSIDPDGDFSNYILPNNITNLESMFRDCENLTVAPEIPDSVTKMYKTFQDCINLNVAPEIPSNVTNLRQTFFNCVALTNPIKINSKNITITDGAFDTNKGGTFLTITIIIPRESTTYTTITNKYSNAPTITIQTF